MEIAPRVGWHKMDERTDRDSDAVACSDRISTCYWLISLILTSGTLFSRASLTKKWRNPSLVLWATTEAVFLALKDFQPQLKQQHVLICHRQHVCVFIYKSSGEWRLHPRVGSDDLEPLALREERRWICSPRARTRIACCCLPADITLTSS